MAERNYRRTEAGSEAFASDDTAVPSDYRRLLGLIESETHFDVIRGRLRQFPRALLEEWLAELEELGYIESSPTEAALDLDFVAHFKKKPPDETGMLKQDALLLERAARDAGAELTRRGVFLAQDRLKNLPPSTKPPEQTVVCIVEDDPDQLALADLRVSMAGYQVRIARSSAEFVQVIRGHAPPDIVLLDVRLPDGNGFDILLKIRSHPKLALLPVVMLTAENRVEDIKHGLTLGADAYVTKPYSKTMLVDTIRKVLKMPY
jgi:CheY-like chemotaxis protein